MIKINLIKEKKPFKLPVLFNILDLSLLNFKFIILFFFIYYVGSMFLDSTLEKKLNIQRDEISKLNTQLSKLTKEIGSNQELRDKLDAFNQQEQKLIERTKVVKKILDERTNPMKLLERIARNTPDDLWLEKISIGSEANNGVGITIEGKALYYKSISEFVNLVNSSSFFGKTLSTTYSGTVAPARESDGARVEAFTVKGRVVTFDPWSQ